MKILDVCHAVRHGQYAEMAVKTRWRWLKSLEGVERRLTIRRMLRVEVA